MTEEEAKTKLCFRAATFGGSQQLADGPGPHCIGSTCMAWRSRRRTATYHTSTGPEKRETDLGGYCGLAGKP